MANNTEHEDFVATLESFKELKTGISGSRIRKLTDYTIAHVKDVETLLSFVINYSRECTPTHKLGSLYIIDSTVRALLSKSDNEDSDGNGEENYYAKGIKILNANILSLLIDGIENSDATHLEKIQELVNIWEKNNVFDRKSLETAKSRLNELISGNNAVSSSASSTYSSKQRSASNTNAKASSLSDRATQILNNIPKFENLPVVHVPSDLLSDDSLVQMSCLKQFLGTLQVELAKHQKLVRVSKPSSNVSKGNNRPTQYIGRDSRNDRSRSPPRNKNERTRQQSNSSSHNNRQQQQQSSKELQGNNHHLYPDEKNIPSNPHYRPKPVSFDPTIPRDHVKVYSRTLFVGGVPQNFKEHDIARMLRQFGEVQSVILNNARKHAFVKVYSRAEAERIMAHFTGGGNPTHGLRIRWAVGFGPRDCCDYQYGFSIIPLARLTEIDYKWSQSAEWGGTGGQPIQTNMVYEEPDIIVGEGVSSKAISQKMPTDKGVLGPKSGKVGQPAVIPQPSMPFSSLSPPPPAVAQQAPVPQVGPVQQQYYNQPNTYQQGPTPAMLYGQNQIMSPPQQQQQQPQQQSQHQNQPQESSQSPQNFDPTAQLNTLMNILNQTSK